MGDEGGRYPDSAWIVFPSPAIREIEEGMALRDHSIKSRLAFGFGLLTFVTMIVGVVSLLEMAKLADLMTKMYSHPLTVSNTVRDIQTNIVSMHRSMKDVVLAQDHDQLQEAVILVDEKERNVFSDFNVIFDRYLGDRGDVLTCFQLFSDWRPIREEVFRLLRNGDWLGAMEITKGRGADHVANIMAEIQAVAEFAQNKADSVQEDAQETSKAAILFMAVVLIGLIALSVTVAHRISRSITDPLETIVRRIKATQQNRRGGRVGPEGGDEVGHVADAISEMSTHLAQRTISIEELNREVEKRRETESALSLSERRFRALASCSPVGVFQTDKEGNCLYVNQRWKSIAGLSDQEAAGQGWVQALHPEDRDRINESWIEATHSDRAFYANYRFQTPDGIVIWVDGRAVPLRNDCEEIIGYIGTITEVRDRKAA